MRILKFLILLLPLATMASCENDDKVVEEPVQAAAAPDTAK